MFSRAVSHLGRLRNQQHDLDIAYVASVRMDGRQGSALLIDTGSPANICGSEWSREMAAECRRAGVNQPRYAPLSKPLTCSGIGKGSQQAHFDVTHTISVGDGQWYVRCDEDKFRMTKMVATNHLATNHRHY